MPIDYLGFYTNFKRRFVRGRINVIPKYEIARFAMEYANGDTEVARRLITSLVKRLGRAGIVEFTDSHWIVYDKPH
ncbi:hypothetical protein [Vulcanisaeta souniana]|uniref:Uncharacterized protein n=1 Tax=Vulcanisaeta souniana JCM 11219 TaxID=1293586 RepID=A0A830EMT3_9CREN|nr:hypothetical protein [Vulcanisaeta souniana]BDR92247.1 hypothetical protein Vsou_13400 [Vulcanisaeta souniana JCM 11219]GGI86159.1 hypothetical protein GCM10007112_23970 [Vulcanisaeta souniana JCM 11219]